MLLDDTVHFALSVGCEALKAEADPEGRAGAWVTKFAGRCGVRSRPDNTSGEYSVRCAWLMGPGVFLVLREGEMQRGNSIQESRVSADVKTGTVSAEVGG